MNLIILKPLTKSLYLTVVRSIESLLNWLMIKWSYLTLWFVTKVLINPKLLLKPELYHNHPVTTGLVRAWKKRKPIGGQREVTNVAKSTATVAHQLCLWMDATSPPVDLDACVTSRAGQTFLGKYLCKTASHRAWALQSCITFVQKGHPICTAGHF